MTATTRHSVGFPAMGTTVNLWATGDQHEVGRAFAAARSFVGSFERALTRFNASSELSRLNAARETRVSVSPLLARLVDTAVKAAESTDGLVDPTLLPELIEAGYERSLVGVKPATLDCQALDFHPAQADPARRWRLIEVDRERSVVSRPPGVAIDSGGVGKGLAADMVESLLTRMLGRGAEAIVDCGGDLRSAELPEGRFHKIAVESPYLDAGELTLTSSGGGVATSGIDRRVWKSGDGQLAHHLIDPSTGRPAWTGLVSVTAVGRDAVEAETLAKQALLSGPEVARKVLAVHGGVISHFDQRVEIVEAK